ncbi:MAG: glucosaminidase domain-containing protein [Tannerella sp.]|jgi:flagellum-specific peptidoglycan hydrolase FlgJ|nr:glucosaminidase domain-containing protein [Tannerella sp.]
MNKESHCINKFMIAGIFTLQILSVCTFSIKASTPEAKSAVDRSVFHEYINTHYKLALRQQKKHKIPASIILAQALLESGAGQSYLALAGNNHFGIKGTDWDGLCIYKNDEGEHTRFRKYLSVIQSFEDHSRVLTERPKYKPLSKLATTDYKGWARGLKQYGYATDPLYASKLIKLIEDYQLYYYDTAKETDPPVKKATPAQTVKKTTPAAQQVKKAATQKTTGSSTKSNTGNRPKPASSAKKK